MSKRGLPDYDFPMYTQKEPVRLFKSSFLEFFSHITPRVVLLIWIPIILFFLTAGVVQISRSGAAVWIVPPALFCGWIMWTLIEYNVHRFIFHYHPRTERVKKIFFTFHGIHHAQPMCKTRLVMPPAISIPIAVMFFLVYYFVFLRIFQQPVWFLFAFAGSAIGYLAYDMIHYVLHHAKSKHGYLAMCRRQHMRHHAKCPNMRFGVSVPIWDYIFGTMPKSGLRKKMTSADNG